jgi:hypothetical protein
VSADLPPAADPVPGWSQSLANGAPGILLRHAELARSGLGDWDTVHRWARAATRHAVSAHPSAGLFRGAPAVAFALSCADRPAYAPVLTALDCRIRSLVAHRLADAHERIDRATMPALREFDLISGLTGLGTYLLHRWRDLDTLRDILTYLVRLTEPLPLDHGRVPGWWTGHGPADEPSPNWVGGHGNLGMAHGITGPLALLSATMRRGVTVPGQPEAIDRICTWLEVRRQGPPGAPWWPATISLTQLHSHRPGARHPHRPSWCYGVAGIARAVQTAGLALADQHRQRMAETALAAAIRDDRQLGQLTDASLCHGWAGLLLAVWHVAADAADPHPLTSRLPYLLGRFDRHLREHPAPGDGFLDGTTGIALARRTTERGCRPLSGGMPACCSTPTPPGQHPARRRHDDRRRRHPDQRPPPPHDRSDHGGRRTPARHPGHDARSSPPRVPARRQP